MIRQKDKKLAIIKYRDTRYRPGSIASGILSAHSAAPLNGMIQGMSIRVALRKGRVRGDGILVFEHDAGCTN